VDASGGGASYGDRVWIRGEYVAWVATTREGLEQNRETTASQLFNGVFALAGAGRDEIAEAAFRGRYGYRLTAGLWADQVQSFGLEGSITYLDRRPVAAPTDSGGLAAVAAGILLPGLSGQGGGTVVVPITAGNLAAGALRLELGDQQFLDLKGLGRLRVFESDGIRTDALIGYRHLVFEESLGVSADITALSLPLLAGSSVAARAAVDSRSVFDGVFLALDWAATCGCLELGIRPSVTVARVENRITREAFGRATVPGVGSIELGATPLLFPGALGQTSSTDWTVLPELEVRLAFLFTPSIRLVVGGSVLAMPSVARATGQLDLGLPVQGITPGVGGVPLAGVVLPPSRDTLILGTMSVGLEFRY
jgi:hypothetical protein